METSPAAAVARPLALPLWKELLPLCLIVFLEFLAMGLPLPVLPVYVHETLGFGPLVIGLVLGMQSIATLATRHAAGTRSDDQGPKRTALIGLIISAAAGAVSALSTVTTSPAVGLSVLLVGRALLGLGESLVITSALAWGVALAGRERSGLVMAWVGIAMYGAIAVGAPLGSAIDSGFGFAGLCIAAMVAPLVGTIGTIVVRPVNAARGMRIPFTRVIKLIILPGTGLALCAIGFGAIAGFSALAFADRGWGHAELAMTAFGIAYVLARLAFGKFPDRFGGARVAVASAATAAVGQLGMWLAPSAGLSSAAAAITGLGFSLAFPSFGVVAIRQVPPQNRGVALGAYTAFFDATMGFGVPVLGLIVGPFGYGAAFATAMIAALGSLAVAAVLVVRPGARG